MRFIASFTILKNSAIRRFIRPAAAVLTAALTALSLSACFFQADEPVAAAIAPAAETSAPPAETLPAEGGELRVPMPYNPASLHPLKIQNMQLCNLYGLIFESLLEIDLSGRPQPCLAETWDVSEDGLTWSFHLRKGIQFHGGGDLTAGDVVFTLGLLEGMTEEESMYAACNRVIESYSAADEHTLTVTTQSPQSAVPFYMNFPVMPKSHYGSGDADAKLPEGTGPYRLDAYDKEEGMTLSVNESWWKTKPYIQKIVAVPKPDNEEELAGYQIGEMDFVPTPIQTSGKYRQYGKTEVLDYMTQYYDCLMPNINDSVFRDSNVRKALAFSIDKGDIISKALINHAVAADFPIPPDSWLYEGKLKIYEYNTARAQELLEESGWKDTDKDGIREKDENGTTEELSFTLLVLETKDITYKKDVANLIGEQLKVMGFDVKIQEKTSENYYNALKNGNFDLALCSFYMDRNPDLGFLLHAEGKSNYSAYSDQEMNELLSNCKKAVREDDLQQAYGALQQKFVDDLPHIALYFRTYSAVYRSRIQGVEKLRELSVFYNISKWYLQTKTVE